MSRRKSKNDRAIDALLGLDCSYPFSYPSPEEAFKLKKTAGETWVESRVIDPATVAGVDDINTPPVGSIHPSKPEFMLTDVNCSFDHARRLWIVDLRYRRPDKYEIDDNNLKQERRNI